MQSFVKPALSLAVCAALMSGCASTEPPLPEGERIPINFSSMQLPPATVGHPVTDVNEQGTRAVVERDRVDPPVEPVVVRDDEPVRVKAPAPVTVTPVAAPEVPVVVHVPEPVQASHAPEPVGNPVGDKLTKLLDRADQEGVAQPLPHFASQQGPENASAPADKDSAKTDAAVNETVSASKADSAAETVSDAVPDQSVTPADDKPEGGQ